MEELTLHSHQLMIGYLQATGVLIQAAFETTDDTFKNDGVVYQVEKQEFSNGIYWIYFQFGKAKPRMDTVFDLEGEAILENPRKDTQIELSRQLFCIFDSVQSVLYISNLTKRSLVENYLGYCLNQEVTVRPFFTDAKSFGESLKTVKSISFVQKSNLFTSASGICEEEKNIFGLGIPDDFTVGVNYSDAASTPAFVDIFSRFSKKLDALELDSLACVGKDLENFERVFNKGHFTKKVTLSVELDSQGIFDPARVKSEAISKLSSMR